MRQQFINGALALTLMVGGAFLTSCQNLDVPEETPNVVEQPESKTLTFRVALPLRGAIEYEGLRADPKIHDPQEYGISSLELFVVNKGTQELLLDPITFYDFQGGKVANTATHTGMWEYVKEYQLKDASLIGAEVDIYAVANEPVKGDLVAGGNIATILSAQGAKHSQAGSSRVSLFNITDPSAPRYEIPMTGKLLGQTLLLNGNYTIELERIVARVDVIVNNKHLQVSDLKINNVMSHSYLYPQGGAKYPNASAVSGVEPFRFASQPAGNVPLEYQKCFYIYENDHERTGKLTSVNVKGTFKGVPKNYPPLEFRDSKGDPVSIKRNHIYRVMLGDKPETGALTATVVSVEDWNTLSFDAFWGAFTVDGTALANYNEDEHLLTVPQGGSSYNFTIKHEYKTMPTVQFEYIPNTQDWVSASVSGLEILVNVAPNTTGHEREAVVKVKHNAYSGYWYSIKVSQGK